MWFKNNKTSEEIVNSVTLSNQALSKIADEFNLELIKDKNGTSLVIPKGVVSSMSETETLSFLDYWNSTSYKNSSLDSKRLRDYKIFDEMDNTMLEATLSLDTYADEMFNVGFVTDPIVIDCSNKLLVDNLLTILKRSGVLENSRNLGRLLCKYGDFAYHIKVAVNDEQPKMIGEISVDDIILELRTPETWKITTFSESKIPICYEDLINDGQRVKSNKYYPWDFIQFSVRDSEKAPYGRGLMDRLKMVFDQLATIEGLLALSRASRVDRLIIKVPVTTANPSAAMAQLMSMKSQLKNTLFKDNNTSNTNSYNKIPSLTDLIFAPSEGFSFEKLNSSIDISSIEDVEYFRDKALTATRLPKGYFLADGVVDNRGEALKAQDLKFARALVPYSVAYATGLTKLCIVLGTYLGYDMTSESNEVNVKIKQSVRVSNEILDSYTNIFKSAQEMVTGYKDLIATDESSSGKVVDSVQFKSLLIKLGMPSEVADLFTNVVKKPSRKTSLPDNLDSYDQISNSKSVISSDPMTELIATSQRKNSLIETTSELTNNDIVINKIFSKLDLKNKIKTSAISDFGTKFTEKFEYVPK